MTFEQRLSRFNASMLHLGINLKAALKKQGMDISKVYYQKRLKLKK